MFKTAMGAAVLVSLAAAPASAAPDDLARSHLAAIASGNVAGITEAYGDAAVLEWVGGPLDGRYQGMAALQDLWTRFTTAQGALSLAVSELDVAANPAGATVTADVRFVKPDGAIPVHYVMTFRGDQLIFETWQIDPPANQ